MSDQGQVDLIVQRTSFAGDDPEVTRKSSGWLWIMPSTIAVT